MGVGKSLEQIVADGERVARVWEANPGFSLGEVKLADVKTLIDEVRKGRARSDELRRQLTESVNVTETKTLELTTITSRALSGIRAVFGPDSSQYEEAGGTRSSERKRPSRKTSKG